jgi:oligopeptide/dipeptide ABC transporter ATP-binding protein
VSATGELWLDGAREPLIEARELSRTYALRSPWRAARHGSVRALEDLWLWIAPGESLGLVGESGSGKTTAARCLLRLVEPQSGQVLWRARSGERVDLLALGPRELRALRPELGIVFQDPLASLDPRQRVGRAIAEPLAVHGRARAGELEGRVRAWIERVGLAPELAERWPHELSGGERQRVALARALVLEPRLLVCDEVVSALDLSVQAQVLDLLDRLQRELELALLFVSHDLNVVRHMADRVLVMYLGRPVEVGTASAVLSSPAHPYTKLLVESAVALEPRSVGTPAASVESAAAPEPPSGCAFHPRCPVAEARCAREVPVPVRVGPGHVAACHLLGSG